MKGETHVIELTSVDLGITDSQENPVFDRTYKMHGDELTLFAMLCDLIDIRPDFKRLVEMALKFNREHDRANCIHCNPAKKN